MKRHVVWMGMATMALLGAACVQGDNDLPSFLPNNARCAAVPLAISVPQADAAMCPAPQPSTNTYPVRPLGFYEDGLDPIPGKVAYLTFDDGPSEWTDQILDILKDKGVRATFFVNARNVKGAAGLDGTYVNDRGQKIVFRDLIKRIVDEGHALGNHTLNHLDMATQSPEKIAEELEQNELLVNKGLAKAGAAPRPLTLIRLPFGSPWNPRPPDPGFAVVSTVETVGSLVAARGLNMMWNLDSTDSNEWAHGESYTRKPGVRGPSPGAPTYDEKVARIKMRVLEDPIVMQGRGANILMHDTHNATRDALGAIIDSLRAAGYTFETLEGYALWRWKRPSIELTPGPRLASACLPEEERSCQTFGSAERVCGRLWQGFMAVGGEAVLGAPVAPPTPLSLAMAMGMVPGLSQEFERGRLELHPEEESPCNVVFVPR